MSETEQAEKPGKPEKQEIASILRDILYVEFMGILKNMDDTLLSRGGGKGLKIYDDIERDAHAFAVLQKRKLAVVSYPWDVESFSDSRLDKKAAEVVKNQLMAIGFDTLTRNLLDATLKGYAVGEIMWDTDGTRVFVKKIIPRDQRRFVFGADYRLRLLTKENLTTGIELPDRKFVVHSVGAKDGSPYGLGLGSKLFWPVFFKRQNITFWLTFADKFGSPTAVGHYPQGTGEAEQNELLNAISSIAQEAAVVIPEGMTLDLLEAARGGAADFYERLSRYMDEQISEAVLGETMTTTSHASGLGSGQAEVHNDVRLELSRADADLLTDTLQETLVKWIVEYNVPGANLPKVWRKIEEQEDLKARADRDTSIKALGYEPTEEYIKETYGDGFVKTVTPAPAVPAFNPNNPDDPAFSETASFPDQQALDDVIGALPDADMAAQMQKVLKPVIDLISKGEDDQVVLGQLAEIYPKMDTIQLQDLLARLIFVSQLWGRLNAEAE